MKAKRKPKSSLSEQIKTLQMGPIKPPAHVTLRECDLPFWESIISSRAKDSWYDSDLIQAANLARYMADIERLSRALSDEEDFIDGRPNPKFKIRDDLQKQVNTMMCKLHIHTSATQGRSRDTGNRTRQEKELINALPEDDLLAQPPSKIH